MDDWYKEKLRDLGITGVEPVAGGSGNPPFDLFRLLAFCWFAIEIDRLKAELRAANDVARSYSGT